MTIEEENRALRDRLNRAYRALSDTLIIMGEHGLRPVKGTSRQDAYRALYEIQEALGTNRIYGIGEEQK